MLIPPQKHSQVIFDLNKKHSTGHTAHQNNTDPQLSVSLWRKRTHNFLHINACEMPNIVLKNLVNYLLLASFSNDEHSPVPSITHGNFLFLSWWLKPWWISCHSDGQNEALLPTSRIWLLKRISGLHTILC